MSTVKPVIHLDVQCNLLRTSAILSLLQNDLNHLISQLGRLWEPRFKVSLDLLKLLSVSIKVAQTDARAPVSGSKGKLQIVGTESVVVDGRVDGFLEEHGVAEEVLCDSEPHARGLDMC
jgi:hypothetical protein